MKSSLPTPRLYQRTSIDAIQADFAAGKRDVVLSTCPGGGKTLMGLHVAEPILAGGECVLVLAHGTSVLRSQWNEEVARYGMTSPHLIIALPHNKDTHIPELLAASGRPLGLVIVDEAHEFYSATMVQTILKRHKPKRQLLMTGTPSQFVLANRHRSKAEKRAIHITSGVEVYTQGQAAKDGPYLQDTNFAVVTSRYALDDGDYNESNDVNATWAPTAAETSGSMDALITTMLRRLRMSSTIVGGSPVATTVLENTSLTGTWSKLFGELHKTLIAAHSIAQAREITRVLVNHGVSAVVSDSEEDVDSDEIRRFQENRHVKVLVVVRRGILGFNMPDLCNVVDFTCSRNIDRIYQLYARVLRVSPSGNAKFFFRMASSLNPMVDTFYLSAALCMNNHEFISKFDGKNLNGMEIIVKKDTLQVLEKVRALGAKKTAEARKAREILVDKLMVESVMGLNLMPDTYINLDKGAWVEWQGARFGEVIQALTGASFKDPEGNKKVILAWCEKNGRRPSALSKDPEERRLGASQGNYCSSGRTEFDPEFRDKLVERWPSNRDPEGKKKAILAWCEANKRRPSAWSKDPEEKRLGRLMSSYCSPGGCSFDPEFRDLVLAYPTSKDYLASKKDPQ